MVQRKKGNHEEGRANEIKVGVKERKKERKKGAHPETRRRLFS
jgi:hypothetical protein